MGIVINDIVDNSRFIMLLPTPKKSIIDRKLPTTIDDLDMPLKSIQRMGL